MTMSRKASPEQDAVPTYSTFLNAILRQHFPSFVRKVFLTVNVGDRFVPGRHIDAICHQLLRMREGEIRRLIVNLPPRSLKSLIASVAYPAWLLGNNPSTRIIVASYSDDLTRRLARDFRRVVEAPWYRAVFPAMQIDARKNTEAEVATTASGFRYATSVGGTLTGRGGDVIIIDDPIKPMDAASEAERRRVNEWFDSTVISRLDDPATGMIAIIMQRVHEDDLSGHLLEKGGWHHLRLPAIATEDELVPLDGRRTWRRCAGDLLEPGRAAADHLDEARRSLGSHLFEAQYQQDPIPAGGTLIRAEWLLTCPAGAMPNAREFDQVVQSWDVASKVGGRNDWSVCTTWGIHGRQYYLLHVLRERMEFPDLLHRASELALQYSAHRVLVEDASSGSALAQALRLGSRGAVIAIKPKLDKPARVQRASAVFEAGRVTLPADAAWLTEYRRELLAFPGGRHDDQVDSTSQFLIWAEEKRPAVAAVMPVIVPLGRRGEWE
jgi:predicted phage terminase large subunit-like protein